MSGSNDLISRQAAIRWVKTECNPYGNPTLDFESGKRVIEHLKQMPSAQPDITNEQAIAHLTKSGWLREHDTQMMIMGYKISKENE